MGLLMMVSFSLSRRQGWNVSILIILAKMYGKMEICSERCRPEFIVVKT